MQLGRAFFSEDGNGQTPNSDLQPLHKPHQRTSGVQDRSQRKRPRSRRPPIRVAFEVCGSAESLQIRVTQTNSLQRLLLRITNAPTPTATAAMPARIAGVKSADNTLPVVGLGVAVGSEVGSCVGCCVGEGEGLVDGVGVGAG
jgi:hypothetical protein